MKFVYDDGGRLLSPKETAAVEMRFTTYGLDFDRTNWFIRAARTEIVVRGTPDDRTTGRPDRRPLTGVPGT